MRFITKLQREKAELLLLKEFVKTNPQVKTMLDELLDSSKSANIKDIIEPIIKDKLKEARMQGVNIGWQAAFLRCDEYIKDMITVEGIKDYIREEANKVRTQLSYDEQA